MIQASICYLERDMRTGNLLPASSEELSNQYSIGQLYLVRRAQHFIPPKIHIKVSNGEITLYDELIRTADRLFELNYRRSNLPVNIFPKFRLNRSIPLQMGFVAHRLTEMSPDLLDLLEEKYDYNVIGESDWKELAE